MDLTPEQFARLGQYFDEAVNLPQSEREALMERVRRDEGDEMANQLAIMLKADEPTNTMDAPPGHLQRPAEPEEACAFREGEVVLGRFRIVRMFPRGGMGEVYEAHDQELGPVALKTIRRDLIGDRGLLRRFKQEVHLGKQVTSQYVCRIHELFILPDKGHREVAAFLTMELLKGTTLAKRIAQGPLPWSEAEPITIELCHGLDAIHAAGMVHRDFKPGNVMLARRGNVTQAVITDFGLALRPEESPHLTRTGGFVGTLPYMAPEQFGGKVSPATDIYALGAVLYEMATGKQAFDTETPPAQRRRPPAASSLKPGVPGHVDRVVERCLAYEPAGRFQTAGEVAKALRGDADHPAPPSPAFLGHGAIAVYVMLLLLAVSGLIAWRIVYGGYKPTEEALSWYQQGMGAYRQGTYLTAKGMFDRSIKADPRFALAAARLADTLNELDFVGDAEEAMLSVAPEAESRLRSVEGEYVEGVRATLRREYDGALTHFKNALAGLPTSEKAMGLVDLGRAYEKAGSIDAALKAYVEARKLPPESPAPYLRSGILEARLARNAEAARDFEQAERLYHDLNNSEGAAEVFYQRSYWQTILRNYELARELARKSYNVGENMPAAAVQLKVRALSRLSAIDHGDYKDLEAIKEANEARDLAEQSGLEYWETDALCRLGAAQYGAIYSDAKNAATHSGQAKQYLGQALGIARKNKWPRLVALAEVNLAAILEARGEIEEPDINGLGAAVQFYQRFGFPTESLNPLLLLARARQSKSEYREGLQSSKELVNLADKYGAPVQRAQAWEEVGHAHFGLQDYAKALKAYEMAIEYARQAHELVNWEACYRANVLDRLGRFDEASAALDQLSPREVEELGGEVEQIKIHVLVDRGRFLEASRLVQTALTNYPSLDGSTGADLRGQGAIALSKLGRTREAMQWISDANTFAQKTRDEEAAAVVAYAEAVVCLTVGSPKQARQAAEGSLQFFQRSGQQESEWLAVAVMAEADAAIGDKKRASSESMIALDMLGKFEHNCLGSTPSTYRARAEVAENCRRLDQLRHL